ncbi:hypothetical protein EJ05DRAFT_122021 [Pseudovirgaria hyperparasitica]|uniref:WD40 repeat-like protein n=1 Tax=Pseudovirgaria hyperparasitica TaxID=470096 RepID=A0A6A6VZF9_9PEZI|nr:uncharacterized protein EJ05DRAFT_122021 [Pseudovirgaria hyperparasitica]KAF2755090.1 hypothetical protein EJ05DRAFT_122021 [Pseudovirgaria hyperparasitica]
MEKKKYFKIEQNHLVPKYDKYSKGSVLAGERLRLKRKREDTKASRLQQERIQRPEAMLSTISGHVSQLNYGFTNARSRTYSYRSVFALGLEKFTTTGAAHTIRDFFNMTEHGIVVKALDSRGLHFSQADDIVWMNEDGRCSRTPKIVQRERKSVEQSTFLTAGYDVSHLDYHAGSGFMSAVSHKDDTHAQLTIDRFANCAFSNLPQSTLAIHYEVRDTTLWKGVFCPSDDAPMLALATSRGLRILRRHNEDYIHMNHPDTKEIVNLMWCDQNILALATRNGVINLYDTRTSADTSLSIVTSRGIAAMESGDDPYRLVAAGLGGSLCLYDVRSACRSESSRGKRPEATKSAVEFEGYENNQWPCTGLATRKELDVVAAGNGDGKLLIWSMKTGQKLRVFDTGVKQLPAVRWHDENGNTEIWAATGCSLTKFAWHV